MQGVNDKAKLPPIWVGNFAFNLSGQLASLLVVYRGLTLVAIS